MPEARAARGRPREFSPERALDAAMHLFWERGYDSTSIEDIERRTGLSRSSLYNCFGSKRELFERAIDAYSQRTASLLESLDAGEHGLADVRRFFDALHARLGARRARPGCLMVNSVIEFGGTDAAMSASGKRYFAGVHAALERALARASRLGEIDGAERGARAHVLLAIAIAMNVHARAGAGREELVHLRRAVDRELASWRKGFAA